MLSTTKKKGTSSAPKKANEPTGTPAQTNPIRTTSTANPTDEINTGGVPTRVSTASSAPASSPAPAQHDVDTENASANQNAIDNCNIIIINEIIKRFLYDTINQYENQQTKESIDTFLAKRHNYIKTQFDSLTDDFRNAVLTYKNKKNNGYDFIVYIEMLFESTYNRENMLNFFSHGEKIFRNDIKRKTTITRSDALGTSSDMEMGGHGNTPSDRSSPTATNSIERGNVFQKNNDENDFIFINIVNEPDIICTTINKLEFRNIIIDINTINNEYTKIEPNELIDIIKKHKFFIQNDGKGPTVLMINNDGSVTLPTEITLPKEDVSQLIQMLGDGEYNSSSQTDFDKSKIVFGLKKNDQFNDTQKNNILVIKDVMPPNKKNKLGNVLYEYDGDTQRINQGFGDFFGKLQDNTFQKKINTGGSFVGRNVMSKKQNNQNQNNRILSRRNNNRRQLF